MLQPTNGDLANLALAQRGALEAARRIAEDRFRRLRARWQIILITVPEVFHPATNATRELGPVTTFHPWSRMPMELQRLVCLQTLHICRVVNIFSDDFKLAVMDHLTYECTYETVLCAEARIWVSPLAGLSHNIDRLVTDPSSYHWFPSPLYQLALDFDKKTLFFEDAAALVSLLEPLGASEHRGRGNEENIVAAFNNNGPKNVVLAAPVQKYEDLYALIKAFAG
ncbi:uncharacterized protein RSE6_04097 [Rhynchosporium secalis]|uniref:Uncharacterized protein n=1 Tax=Rhynchosporium secalis TaxID=38038 RepID=A0A1E1M4G4_RHYSE|nr:uncharacterized protein RSE6_04097 [Rhynchosporium secalis]